MNQRLPFARVLVALCCAVLLCAQTFGLARGYSCACSGQPEWTAQDHCHGPHDASCHDEAAAQPEHEESDGLGERRDHQQVRDEVQSRLASTLEAPALVPLLVSVLVNESAVSMPTRALRSEAATRWSRGSPPGVAVARTVVLLI